MIRTYCSAGGTVDEFYNSTFDEVLLVIMGQVDAWRIDRMRAWKIVEGYRGTKDMPSLKEFYSLPYDDEMQEQVVDQSSWYNEASKELANFNWPERKN